MLQEILLSLSGHRSPLWDQVKDSPESASSALRTYLTPSEKALLAPLAHLSDLHIKIRDHAADITNSHPSMIGRAVASSIRSQNLSQFRQKILEVEKSILMEDAAYVGAYRIVPLSTVVSEFEPWTRRMEWLWKILTTLQSPTGSGPRRKAQCTGADIINYLENETYTGYSDLEEMATALLQISQRIWMRQIATWVLYGKLPSHSCEDFCIGETDSRATATGKVYVIRDSLLPKFVSQNAAATLLSIGESLNQIRLQTSMSSQTAQDPVLRLLPESIAQLNALIYPLSAASFANTMSSIRLSISQNALSQLLPLPKVLEILDVIQEFQLLGRGEFSTALVNHADARISRRLQEVAKPIRKAGRLDDMSVKEAEASAVLAQAFTDLASRQNDDEEEDEILEKARSLFRLTVKIEPTALDTIAFISTLLPSPTSLELVLPKDSAINLFLSPPDLKTYSSINSYLISLRRAELHLSSLWKITPLRRCNPTPLGPPASARPLGQKMLAARRLREEKRTAQMRKHWASASKALYLLNEFGAYFQGEVIHRCWKHFRSWVYPETANRPASAASGRTGSRPGTAASAASKQSKLSQLEESTKSNWGGGGISARNDPVALAQAHRLYLRNLNESLLLGHTGYVEALRHVLTTLDHFIALFTRLQGAWQGIDLQEDEGVIDALSDFFSEETEVLEEMTRSGKLLEEGLAALVRMIGKLEIERDGEGGSELVDEMDALGLDSPYVPRKERTLDRLTMKLDMLEGAREVEDDGKMFDDE